MDGENVANSLAKLVYTSQNGDAFKNAKSFVFCQFVLLYHSPVKNPPVYKCVACVRVDDPFYLVDPAGDELSILEQK